MRNLNEYELPKEKLILNLYEYYKRQNIHLFDTALKNEYFKYNKAKKILHRLYLANIITVEEVKVFIDAFDFEYKKFLSFIVKEKNIKVKINENKIK